MQQRQQVKRQREHNKMTIYWLCRCMSMCVCVWLKNNFTWLESKENERRNNNEEEEEKNELEKKRKWEMVIIYLHWISKIESSSSLSTSSRTPYGCTYMRTFIVGLGCTIHTGIIVKRFQSLHSLRFFLFFFFFPRFFFTNYLCPPNSWREGEREEKVELCLLLIFFFFFFSSSLTFRVA